MHSFAGIPYVLILAPMVLVILATVLITTRRHAIKDIVCPRDGLPREVVFFGHTIDPDVWENVVSCRHPGEAPLSGRHLTCDRACLRDAEHSPRRDLVEP